MVDVNERILLNMAINNVESEIQQKTGVGVFKFNQMVLQRYKIYKELHKEIENGTKPSI